MRRGDLGTLLSKGLAFHWDCLFEPTPGLRPLKNLVRSWGVFSCRALRPGASRWSWQTYRHSDYLTVVVLTGNQWQTHLDYGAMKIKHRLEDQYSFVCSRLVVFPELSDLRTYLYENDWVEAYYDPDEARLQQISVRARPFDSWNLVGY